MRRLNWTSILGFGLAIIGLLFIIIVSCSKVFNDWSGNIDADLANKYGGFIGGLVGPIFSLAGFFLLYETILAQRQSFDSQQSSFELQQFETKFFELIRIHRDNVSQMVHRVPWDQNENFYEKARVFVEMRSQFEKLYKITLRHVIASPTILSDDKKKASINIAYLILFFGSSRDTRSDLEHFLSKGKYDKNLTEAIIAEVYTQKTAYKSETVYYGGHQVRLGHYYRHLFQAVKFVDRAVFVSPEQKYEYVKTLRAQLSQHELAIFFLNSLSIGKEWENQGYITTYKFVKNLPQNFLKDINPKDYYGKFKYEWEK